VVLQDIADRVNEILIEAVKADDFSHAIFGVDAARGGKAEVAGIFWADFNDLAQSLQCKRNTADSRTHAITRAR